VHVLLVEDDEPIAQSLRRGLLRFGYTVEWVRTGAEALSADPGGMVLLDLGLPDADGLDVCKEIRSRSSVPIIIISARSEEVDRIVGLEIGADDYVSKPFGVREVIARMRAVLRRVQPQEATDATHPATEPAPSQESFANGRLTLDRRARRVLLDGGEITLAPKEYDLFAFLIQELGAVFTRESIMEAVWDEHWFGSTKTLDVHVAVLRKKLGAVLSVETVRGVGFRLVEVAA
jgi:DNA-binding response OmpR family regulator